jgi:hypothetical protein
MYIMHGSSNYLARISMTGDLPGDLLGDIYRRCSSPYDRVRFAAVCKSWRAAASCQPELPAVPLLYPSTGDGFLDKKAQAYNPEDGGVLRAGLPWFSYGKRVVGSYQGSWVALAADDWVEIRNLFTGARAPGRGRIACTCPASPQFTGKIIITKLVFSKYPTSDDCILAAITTGCKIALYTLACSSAGWTTLGCGTGIGLVDIVFSNGELYGLTSDGILYKVVISINESNDKVDIALHELAIKLPMMFGARYIFELGDKLAAAYEVRPEGRWKARTFKVFELVNTQLSKYAWVEVMSLGDHALFLGPGCCNAVRVSASGMHHKVERNCIYYSEKEYFSPCIDLGSVPMLNLGSCIVYCFESKRVDHSEGIMSRGYHYRDKGDNDYNRCTWILPPYF